MRFRVTVKHQEKTKLVIFHEKPNFEEFHRKICKKFELNNNSFDLRYLPPNEHDWIDVEDNEDLENAFEILKPADSDDISMRAEIRLVSEEIDFSQINFAKAKEIEYGFFGPSQEILHVHQTTDTQKDETFDQLLESTSPDFFGHMSEFDVESNVGHNQDVFSTFPTPIVASSRQETDDGTASPSKIVPTNGIRVSQRFECPPKIERFLFQIPEEYVSSENVTSTQMKQWNDFNPENCNFEQRTLHIHIDLIDNNNKILQKDENRMNKKKISPEHESIIKIPSIDSKLLVKKKRNANEILIPFFCPRPFSHFNENAVGIKVSWKPFENEMIEYYYPKTQETLSKRELFPNNVITKIPVPKKRKQKNAVLKAESGSVPEETMIKAELQIFFQKDLVEDDDSWEICLDTPVPVSNTTKIRIEVTNLEAQLDCSVLILHEKQTVDTYTFDIVGKGVQNVKEYEILDLKEKTPEFKDRGKYEVYLYASMLGSELLVFDYFLYGCITCDQCQKIIGPSQPRWKCLMCPNYDTCPKCNEVSDHPHKFVSLGPQKENMWSYDAILLKHLQKDLSLAVEHVEHLLNRFPHGGWPSQETSHLISSMNWFESFLPPFPTPLKRDVLMLKTWLLLGSSDPDSKDEGKKLFAELKSINFLMYTSNDLTWRLINECNLDTLSEDFVVQSANHFINTTGAFMDEIIGELLLSLIQMGDLKKGYLLNSHMEEVASIFSWNLFESRSSKLRLAKFYVAHLDSTQNAQQIIHCKKIIGLLRDPKERIEFALLTCAHLRLAMLMTMEVRNAFSIFHYEMGLKNSAIEDSIAILQSSEKFLPFFLDFCSLTATFKPDPNILNFLLKTLQEEITFPDHLQFRARWIMEAIKEKFYPFNQKKPSLQESYLKHQLEMNISPKNRFLCKETLRYFELERYDFEKALFWCDNVDKEEKEYLSTNKFDNYNWHLTRLYCFLEQKMLEKTFETMCKFMPVFVDVEQVKLFVFSEAEAEALHNPSFWNLLHSFLPLWKENDLFQIILSFIHNCMLLDDYRRLRLLQFKKMISQVPMEHNFLETKKKICQMLLSGPESDQKEFFLELTYELMYNNSLETTQLENVSVPSALIEERKSILILKEYIPHDTYVLVFTKFKRAKHDEYYMSLLTSKNNIFLASYMGIAADIDKYLQEYQQSLGVMDEVIHTKTKGPGNEGKPEKEVPAWTSQFWKKTGDHIWDLLGIKGVPLEDIKRLIIVPTGSWHNISFASLPALDKEKKFLLEQFEVVYCSTLGQVISALSPLKKVSSFLATANDPLLVYSPNFDLAVDTPNDGGKKFRIFEDGDEGPEVEVILKNCFGDSNVSVFHGDDALKENILEKCSSPIIFHFSSHGLYSPDISDWERFINCSQEEFQRLESKFLVSPLIRTLIPVAGANTFIRKEEAKLPPKAGNGIICSADIESLDLSRTELVVLSLCCSGVVESNHARVMKEGIRKGFLDTGAKTLIMTLWSVWEDSTIDIMKRFYVNLLEKNMTKSEALRQSQLEHIREVNEHPFSWAAFICEGDFDSIQVPSLRKSSNTN